MSLTTLQWLLALHIFGFTMWTGGLIGLANILSSHAGASKEHWPGFHNLEKKIAIGMDIGALLAMGFGFALLFSLEPSPMKQPWMHIKLTIVFVALFGMHGFLRVKVRKFRDGSVGLPPFMAPLLTVATLAVIVLAIVRPLAK